MEWVKGILGVFVFFISLGMINKQANDIKKSGEPTNDKNDM